MSKQTDERAELIERFERLSHRMGELWERCQGKGWPEAESSEFTKLRDVTIPSLRSTLLAADKPAESGGEAVGQVNYVNPAAQIATVYLNRPDAVNAGDLLYTNPQPQPSALPDVVKDAERYRWLRGGSDVPPHSIRWPRWEVRNWDGQYWQTLFAEQVDAAIDAAMLKEWKA